MQRGRVYQARDMETVTLLGEVTIQQAMVRVIRGDIETVTMQKALQRVRVQRAAVVDQAAVTMHQSPVTHLETATHPAITEQAAATVMQAQVG